MGQAQAADLGGDPVFDHAAQSLEVPLALPEPLRPKADHELRVFSLVAFTRTVSSFIIDVMKLDLPPNLHNWVRLIRDIDRIRVNVLLVTFKDGLEVTPAPSLDGRRQSTAARQASFSRATPVSASSALSANSTFSDWARAAVRNGS